MNAIRKVGIVGLGRMGLPMAQHLQAKGFAVSGCDPAAPARAKAKDAGIAVLGSPREVAQASDLAIVVVGYDEEVETAVFGAGGIAESAKRGLIVAIGSTIAPAYAGRLAARLAGKGIVLIDAPLARGEAAASPASSSCSAAATSTLSRPAGRLSAPSPRTCSISAARAPATSARW